MEWKGQITQDNGMERAGNSDQWSGKGR